MRFRRFVFVAALLGAGCSDPPPAEFAEQPPALRHVEGADESAGKPVKELPGVDTSQLGAREKAGWWRLVVQLYSPCASEAVSLSQCVEEARPCKACTPMAQFLADRMRGGATSVDAEAGAALRFGPDVAKVEVGPAPSVGPADAPVTVMIWLDPQCPACKHTEPLIRELQEKHPKEVRVVHKLYALPKHTYARAADHALVAAMRQNKFWQLEKALFDAQEDIEQGKATVDDQAKKVGLDMKRYSSDADAKDADAYLERDMKQADEAGLHATPFILINGRHFDQDYFKLDELESWVELELELTKK